MLKGNELAERRAAPRRTPDLLSPDSVQDITAALNVLLADVFALYREVVYLIEQGVLDVADSDAAVCWGPGLRWGLMGPNLLFHLAGGEGGIQHFMEHLSGPVATWWKDLGTITEFSPEVKKTIVNGVLKEANGRSIAELERERDEMLLELLTTRSKEEATAHAG